MKTLSADQQALLVEIMRERQGKVEREIARLNAEREDLRTWLAKNDTEGRS